MLNDTPDTELEQKDQVDEWLQKALEFLINSPLTPNKEKKSFHNLSSRAAQTFYAQNYQVLKELQITLLSLNQMYQQEPKSLKSALRNPHHPKKKKSVSFHSTKINQICLFLQTMTPEAIQHSNTYFEADLPRFEQPRKLKCLNFIASPYSDMDKIRLSDISLNGNMLIGTIQVANLAFHKQVTIRYSGNHWKDYDQCDAVYSTSKNNLDVFMFQIKVDNVNRLEFAIQYQVNNQVFWNNNHGKNFIVAIVLPFKKVSLKKTSFCEQATHFQVDFSTRMQQKVATMYSSQRTVSDRHLHDWSSCYVATTKA